MDAVAIAFRRVTSKQKLQYFVAVAKSGLSHLAVRVLVIVVCEFDRGYGCSCAVRSLAERCGCGWRTVDRALVELREAGFLWSEFRSGRPTVHVPIWPVHSARGCVVTPVMGDRGPLSRVTANSRQYQFKKEGIRDSDGTYRRLMSDGLGRK